MTGKAEDEQVRREGFHYFPKLTEYFFYINIFLGLFMLPFLCSKSSEAFRFHYNPTMDKITYWIDPLVVQILYAGIVMLVIAAYLYRKVNASVDLHHSKARLDRIVFVGRVWKLKSKYSKRWIAVLSCAIAILLVSGLMCFEYFVAEPYFKQSFGELRPANTFVMSPVEHLVFSRVGTSGEGSEEWKQGGAPSGFCLRQLWLLLVFVLFYEQLLEGSRDPKRDMVRRVTFYGVGILVFCFIAYSRVFRQFHSFFDIGITIGLGTFFFWLAVVLPHSFLYKKVRHLADIVGVSFAYIPLFFFYSHSSFEWVTFSIFMYPSVAVIYALITRKVPYSRLYEKELKKRWSQ